MLASASRLIVAKGKKISEFSGNSLASDDAVKVMLGPTGNLRGADRSRRQDGPGRLQRRRLFRRFRLTRL